MDTKTKAEKSAQKPVKETVTGAEALMRSLLAEGVDTIFGYIGGAIMPEYGINAFGK